jgi:hypothetical protein
MGEKKDNKLHSLSIQIEDEDDWENKNKINNQTPKCLGGKED